MSHNVRIREGYKKQCEICKDKEECEIKELGNTYDNCKYFEE